MTAKEATAGMVLTMQVEQTFGGQTFWITKPLWNSGKKISEWTKGTL